MNVLTSFGVGLVLVLAFGCKSYHYDETRSPPPLSQSGGAGAASGDSRGASSGAGTSTSGGAADARDPFDRAMDEIDAARNLPLPEGNYRIDVERIWVDANDSLAIDGMFAYADEHWTVAGGAPPTVPGGVRVGVTKGNFSASLNVALKNSKSSSREQLMLVTVADYPASIQVGEVRYAAPFSVPGGSGIVVFPSGQMVGTSLEVLVRAAGQGLAQVSLTPVFSALGKGGETVRVTSMTTTVFAPIGQPFLIANHSQQHNDVTTTLFSRTTSSGSQQAVLVLRVTGG